MFIDIKEMSVNWTQNFMRKKLPHAQQQKNQLIYCLKTL